MLKVSKSADQSFEHKLKWGAEEAVGANRYSDSEADENIVEPAHERTTQALPANLETAKFMPQPDGDSEHQSSSSIDERSDRVQQVLRGTESDKNLLTLPDIFRPNNNSAIKFEDQLTER